MSPAKVNKSFEENIASILRSEAKPEASTKQSSVVTTPSILL
jgi:hypothetical protein